MSGKENVKVSNALEKYVKESSQNFEPRTEKSLQIAVINDESKKEDKVKLKLTKTEILILAMLCLQEFIGYASLSMMAPIYPTIAANKGMTPTVVGLVFGFYAFIIFISSPLFGKTIPKIGIKFTFIVGEIFTGTCGILFGTVHYIEDYTLFTTASFVLRGFEALGASASTAAGYAIIAHVFTEHSGFVRGLMEVFVGIGLCTGPAISALLYTVGGFGLPFHLMGVVILCAAPISYCVLPRSKEMCREAKMGNYRAIMKIPRVILECIVLLTTSTVWASPEPTIAQFLRHKYNVTTMTVGWVFLLASGMYGISSLTFGWVIDKANRHNTRYHWLIPSGAFLLGISFLFLGPSPFLSFIEGYLWLDVLALCLKDIFVGMVLMASYQAVLDNVLLVGFEDNASTHSLVAGVWYSMYSLGEVLGPVLGGYLTETYGFPTTNTILCFVSLTVCFISVF